MLISGSDSLRVYPTNSEGGQCQIYGVGFENPSIWFLPARSMATLIKVDNNVWYLSGYGLQDDD